MNSCFPNRWSFSYLKPSLHYSLFSFKSAGLAYGDKTVVLVLFFFVFSLSGFSCWVLPYSRVFCLFFQSCFALWPSSLGNRELIYVCLVQLFVYFARVIFCPFCLPLGYRVGCGLWLWHSLDVPTFFFLLFKFCKVLTVDDLTMNCIH